MKIFTLKKKLLMLALLFVGWSATAATYTVTQITDNGTSATSGSLSWAINAVVDGDIIAFNLSSGDVVTLSAALPNIVHTLTMEGINIATGNPVTIQVTSPGVSPYRVFYSKIFGKTITLNDLILSGGDVSGLTDKFGGVISNLFSTLNLNRCVVKDGKASLGGGIYSTRAKFYLDQCTVSNNTATSDGGGVYVIVSTSGLILNSTITGNASASRGGGIFNSAAASSTKLQIINTTISGNSAVTSGGGIYLYKRISYVASCYVLNGIIINNTALSGTDIERLDVYDCRLYPFSSWSSYIATNITNTAYTTGDLGVLANNGGPTPTMALSASAPAYQTGTYAYYNATDGYYYYNGTAYVKLLGGTPTYHEADKILTDQRGTARAATPSMGAYDGVVSNPMQLVFTTTEAGQAITLPLYGTVDCTVDWGDGTATEDFTTTGDKEHTFATAGTYTVEISGELTQFGNGDTPWVGVDYLIEVEDFGDLGLTSLSGAFNEANNLTSVPAILPTTVLSLEYAFNNINRVTITNLDLWDVSHVTNMSNMFSAALNFNQNIGSWDVSHVTNMNYLFLYATAFNQNIGNWNTSNVTDMAYMFLGALAFNQDISTKTITTPTTYTAWDVSNVTTMEGMFAGDLLGLGGFTPVFNQDISNWDVAKVVSMKNMFAKSSFDQNIGAWDISSVTTMTDMFTDVTLSTTNYDAILTGWAAQTVQSGVTFSGGNSKYSAGAAATARQSLIADDSWTITDGGQAPIPMQLVFITTADNQSIALPLYGTVACTVNWGDGSATEDFTTTGNKAHTFATAGTYTVEISGSLTQFGDEWEGTWTGVEYLTEVLSFGELGLESLEYAFSSAINLTSVPATLPTTVTSLWGTFYSINQESITNLNLWDVSKVTNMSYMFRKASNFNQNISTWNVSSVTNMERMFSRTDKFNQNIGSWNVGNVTNMYRMFNDASDFNQNIGSWNVSNVSNMREMFAGATAFDQNLDSWQIGAVTDMTDMFADVTLSTANYDAILTSWAAQTVQTGVTFGGGNSKYSAGEAATARQSLIADDSWTITDGGQAPIPMQLVFTTTAASQSIALPLYGTVNCTVDWGDGSAAEDFTTTGNKEHTFATAGTYTVEISGTLTQFGNRWTGWAGAGYLTEVVTFGEIGLTSLFGAFLGADNLTSVPATLPAAITNLQDIFRDVNRTSITNLNLWDVSHVTNMSRMFFQSEFNQDISGWNVSSATDMNNMFLQSDFDQNIGSWQIGAVTNMVNMFKYVTLSTANYDAILIGWAAQTVQPNVIFHGGNSQYSAGAAATARASLISDDSWTITDGGQAPIPMQLVFTTTADNKSIALPLYGTVACTVNWGDGSVTEDFTSDGMKEHTYATAGTYTVEISGSLTRFGDEWEGTWTGVEYLTEVLSFGELGLESLEYAFSSAINLTSVPATLPTTVTSLWGTFYRINQESITNLNLWDVSKVTNMNYLFLYATAFNQNIGNWNTSNVTDMAYVFCGAFAFNQDISTKTITTPTTYTAWDVSNVTTMEGMFAGDLLGLGGFTPVFNQDISNWDVAKVVSMKNMFAKSSFDQNIGAWDISSVTTMTDMFTDVTLSTTNYDAILTGWAAQTVQSGVTFSGGNSKYSAGAAATARASLISDDSWTITDGGLNTTTIINETSNADWHILHNPANNYFSIGGLKGNAEVSVIDMNGKIIQKKAVTGSSLIYIDNLPTGLYIVFVNNNEKTMKLKLLKH